MKALSSESFRQRALSPASLTGLALTLILLVACFYNLENYPTIWWDEAIFSETAANLVQHGRYAFTEQSPQHLSDLDYRISAGPAVILPVALAYRFLGVGLESGRLVAGGLLFLTFAALFGAARRLWGTATALVAVALALLGTDVLYWGRSVLGDVPALGMFLIGLIFLLKGLTEDNFLSLGAGGLFLGLAFAAKEFYALAFLPPLVLIIRRHWGTWPRLGLGLLSYSLGLAVPLAAYLGLKVLILGNLAAAVNHFLYQKLLLRHEFFTPLTIGRVYPESFAYLLGHPLFWLGLLGLMLIWRREKNSPALQLWSLNFLLWSLVYLTAVYWYRFALPALFLASPLAACFLLRGLTRLTAHLPPHSSRPAAIALLTVLMVLWYPHTGLHILEQVLTTPTSSPARLVDYLRRHVPKNCLIETPEYELTFLDDDHQIHLMPAFFFVESTPEGIKLLNPRWQPYDFDSVAADYLILGSFGKSVFRQIYAPERVARNWRKIAQVDFYDIYVPRHRPHKVWKSPPPSRWAQPPPGSSMKSCTLPGHALRTSDNSFPH